MAHVAEEKWLPEGEHVVDAELESSDMDDVLPSNEFETTDSPKEVHGRNLDKKKGIEVSDMMKFDDTDETTKGKNKISHEAHASQLEMLKGFENVGELLEEEIVELEFEKVKPKLETHTMHCPNCKSEITKVILRRKVFNYPTIVQPVVPVEAQPGPPEDLVGCLSCLSLFTCSDNGCFDPFNIFRKRPGNDSTAPPKVNEKAKIVVRENESCLSMFWVIGKKQNDPKAEDPQQPNPVPNGKDAPRPFLELPESSNTTRGDVAMIDIEDESEPPPADAQPSGRPWLGYEGILIDILKSIVYGGLMEVIASLSIVASAAASDATTLSIVAMAIASVIGGVFVIGHNLWDLRDDCYKESPNEATRKYKELLGQVEHFPLHTFVAILSFLIFGLVPPVAYGYSFYETHCKDYTRMVVAIASLLCVLLLAIIKAYVNKCKVYGYFKTVVYYITIAVSVSGVSYIIGNLVSGLIEEYGLFNTFSSNDGSNLPQANTLSFQSF
ncbi:hypothetical protein CTI12_AA325080 [Artemisia annua]|uniref:Membrane protein of ER body-like protein n=1 Tax=Artemisia annua TaxID=35608 RepID=A0A2U1MVP1_ARTAN|nr:hypothetical protein CTI12_AA325080 [Artemisia annua]